MATKNAVKGKKASGNGGAKNVPIRWEAEMEDAAREDAKRMAAIGGTQVISTRGGVFTFNGEELEDVRGVILADIFENDYYADKFDPDTHSSPVCFAFSVDGVSMAPHAESHERQHETCKGCPQNAFGTADTGRGKACGNRHKLAIIAANELDDVPNATIVSMMVPVTSVKNFGTFTKAITNALKVPLYGLVTHITVEKNKKTQHELKFTPLQHIKELPNPGATWAALKARRQEALDMLTVPYHYQAPEPKAKGKVSKKKSRF